MLVAVEGGRRDSGIAGQGRAHSALSRWSPDCGRGVDSGLWL
jgi:hypothetical protein